MPVIHDSEFGEITIRRNPQSSHVRIRVAPNGTLRVSMPSYAPLFLVKRMLKTNREEIRSLLSSSMPKSTYHDGMQIGKSHSLIVKPAESLAAIKQKRQIILSLPNTMELSDPKVIDTLRPLVIAALRLEAKSHLPKRLEWLAQKHGFSYQKVRFSHAAGRWGSCSSNKTISLNIALMKIPFELIDYVLIHELSHTVHMNHSREFWDLVASADPNYKKHRADLKKEVPAV